MLVAITQQYMANVGVLPTSTILESGFSVLPILNATLFVRNASPGPIQVTLKSIFDLGVNINPLFSGTYLNTLVQQTILPGQMLVHEFESKILDLVVLTHKLELVAVNPPGGVVLSFLRGMYEDVGRVPPTQLPVVF